MDEKYGKSLKLKDVVVNNIRRFKNVHEREEYKFLHVIDRVERGYHDLFCKKLVKTMSNNAVVIMVEEKLSKDIGRKWAKEVNKTGSSVKDKDKFPFLLKLLLEQRRIIEYKYNI